MKVIITPQIAAKIELLEWQAKLLDVKAESKRIKIQQLKGELPRNAKERLAAFKKDMAEMLREAIDKSARKPLSELKKSE